MKKKINPSANVRVVRTPGIATNSLEIIKKNAIENPFVQPGTDPGNSITSNRNGRIHQ